MIATTTLEEVSLQVDPVGSGWLVAAVAAALAVVLLAVPPDRTRVGGRGLALLVGLRLLAFLALVACMLRPTIVGSRKARQTGTVLVLADASKSMTVADGPDGRTRWQELTAALAAAEPAAGTLVADGGFEVACRLFDRESRPVPPMDGRLFPLGEWRDEPSAAETAIGAALDDALDALAGRSLAGVIVLGDGAQQAYAPRDLPPQAAARRIADLGTPLWSITFGQQRAGGQGRDAAVVGLAASETVAVKNTLEVAGRVRLEGFAGREAEVRLLVENDAGRLEQVASRRVQATGETTEEAVQLEWTPTSVGERKLVLRVEPAEGEVVISNNELSTFVDVIDGGLRVLYLEGGFRVEQRFIRRVLAASPDIEVDFQLIDSGRRERWPVDIAKILAAEHDVFLIGDLDAAALRREDLETIRGRVEGGAGIGLLGGLHAFEAGGWAGSALGPLVPFAADRLARQPFDAPMRAELHLPGPLRMLPDPQFGGISILRLGKDPADTRAAWEALPTLDGANDLGRLTPTAKPLARTAEGKPLLVAGEYGAGRVLAFAADSTWRWAMQGAADAHRRFWRQLVLWLAKQDGAEDDALWVRLAQRRIPPGTPLDFDAGIGGGDEAAAGGGNAATFQASLVSPSGQRRVVRLSKRGDGVAGVLTGCTEPGDWRLVVEAARQGAAAPRSREARFTVIEQDLELANPRANPLLMRQLAEATTGGVRVPEELPAIFAEIGGRPPEFETREQWSSTPWDSWPMLLLLAGCLCGEWILRKRWGLV